MDKNRLPVHIAIIMDGNGRWAKKRGLPRIMGHKEGAESVRAITETCAQIGIKYLTFYAFSTENWKRPKPEVKFLMSMLDSYLKRERATIMKNNIRFKSIGDRKKLPDAVVEKINYLEKESLKNTGLTMILALNYGSRDEIKKAVIKIAKKVKTGEVKPSDITEKMIEENLYTKNIPDPDLMIRTSGEMRISNFLLWQLAYSELYVTGTLWPDFRKKELAAAIEEYQKRDRRFGGLTNG
ncbi:MAG: di-trans,poly-cis-decaprenylcistransferase [Candidatus Goldiibacteriota bacterium HGW-Goldbacteria-1]|nr:MAG: di-trans,poly-cis-decaprenylcistransferase [Candidatus Goldiibacteriota bacterium HGW-Goldbacteria-1]